MTSKLSCLVQRRSRMLVLIAQLAAVFRIDIVGPTSYGEACKLANETRFFIAWPPAFGRSAHCRLQVKSYLLRRGRGHS